MINVILLNYYDQCHSSECHYEKCHSSECYYDQCHSSECQYDQCHSTECRGVIQIEDVCGGRHSEKLVSRLFIFFHLQLTIPLMFFYLGV